MQQRTLLRRVLRRVLETAFEKVLSFLEGFLEGVLQWVLMERRVLRRVLRRGSKKGLSRRHLEGRSTPFREYDPVGVRPILRNCNFPAFVGHFPFFSKDSILRVKQRDSSSAFSMHFCQKKAKEGGSGKEAHQRSRLQVIRISHRRAQIAGIHSQNDLGPLESQTQSQVTSVLNRCTCCVRS